jgi:hypothetical protein
MSINSAGKRFKDALAAEKPLQIMGTVNAYAAMMATQVGYKAIYLSGAGVANYSYGLPDLGITSLEDVLIDARRITSVVDTPLLVDIDTGWGGAFNIGRSVKEMIRAGVAAVHIKSRKSVAVIVQTKKSSANKKWLIASKPRSMQKPMLISSSWRGLIRCKPKAYKALSIVPVRLSKRVQMRFLPKQ